MKDCVCEDCVIRWLLEREPITYKGFRVLTQDELAMLDCPWPPEPE